MATTKQAPVKKAAVKATPAPAPEAEVQVKPTAHQRLAEVLVLIGRETATPISDPEKVKFGKAIPLAGGGSVYINRGNADVRGTTGQVAALAKTIKGSAVRGPQGQYLRITF